MAGHLVLKRALGPRLSQERDALYDDDGITYVEFGTVDSAAFSSGSYPVGRPTDVTTAYSYETCLYLKCTKAPDNQIDNIRFWGTGDNPTGIVMYVGTASDTAITPRITVSTVAVFSATSYSSIDDSMLWSEYAITDIGDISATLVMQANVLQNAIQGNHSESSLIFHYAFDES